LTERLTSFFVPTLFYLILLFCGFSGVGLWFTDINLLPDDMALWFADLRLAPTYF